MACLALVPIETRRLFEQHGPADVACLFYRMRKEPLIWKVLRKAGLVGPQRALDRRFRIVEGDGRPCDVEVLWLSTSAWFPPDQMSCLLDRLGRARWVYSQATGTDHLDLDDFQHRGVMVSNIGRLNSRRVAEMALADVLAQAKRLPEHIAMYRSRRWRSLASQRLSDLTVGIVGTGNIGGELARLCRALGIRVIGASRTPSRFGADPCPYDRLVPLAGGLGTLLAEADHVVLTLPLNEETRGLIGPAELALMKPKSSLINVSRGALVDEVALCDALSDGRIAAAYIDVPCRLRPGRWHGLYRTPGVILTHYSAANVEGSLEAAFEQFVGDLEVF